MWLYLLCAVDGVTIPGTKHWCQHTVKTDISNRVVNKTLQQRYTVAT